MNEQKRRIPLKVALIAGVTMSLAAGCGTDEDAVAQPTEATVTTSQALAPQASTVTAPTAESEREQLSSNTSAESTVTDRATGRDATADTTPAAARSSEAQVNTAEVYAYLTSFDSTTGVGDYDKVDAFFGEDAARACAEDGETETANDRCTGYYYRNVNPRIRQIPVAPDATIRTLDGADLVTGDSASLAAAVRESGGSQLFKMQIEQNQAVAVTAIYLP